MQVLIICMAVDYITGMIVAGVCKMLKTKYDFLIKRYEELGIIDYYRATPSSDVFYGIIVELLETIEDSLITKLFDH